MNHFLQWIPSGNFMYLCSSTSTIVGAYLFYNRAYCHLQHTAKMSNDLLVCCGCQSPQSRVYSLLNWYSLAHDCVLLLNGLLEFITQVCKCGPWHLEMFNPVIRSKGDIDDALPPISTPFLHPHYTNCCPMHSCNVGWHEESKEQVLFCLLLVECFAYSTHSLLSSSGLIMMTS